MKSKFLKRVMVLLMAALLTMSVPMVAFASEEGTTSGNVADFLQEGDKDGGIFSSLVEKIRGVGQDAYQLMLVIGIVMLVISLVALGITTALTKQSQTQQENKKWAVNIAIGGCILFGAITLVGLVANIATSF